MTPTPHVSEKAVQASHEAVEVVREKMNQVKPKLRGWLHTAVSPLAVAAGVVLIVLSPTLETKVGSALFAGTAILLFTVSGIYHRGNWTKRTWEVLRRFDHANIFLYTPFTIILLDGAAQTGLLIIVWSGAILGVGFRILWIDAPRWLYVPIYVALGWAAIFYANDFSSAGHTVIVLIAVGGGLYTLGGLIYALKWPDPYPTWFGFHELFHVFTIGAFVCHYVAASIATYQLR
ncbi:MAG: hemolysin III family protein [Propionibacteriales bacterium]|nr:hemolysin III family protein [Propionibacteriales bacterium]